MYRKQCISGKRVSIVTALCAILVPTFVSCELSEQCRPGVEYQDGNECKACVEGTHLNRAGDGCDKNTDNDCGVEHVDCVAIKNVKSAVCDKKAGKCTISCMDGFQESVGKCIPGEETACVNDLDCPRDEHALSIECKQNRCEVKCIEGYHVNTANVCVENIYTTCDTVDDCRTKVEGFDKGSCNSGSCMVSLCQVGYHLNEKKTACDPDTEIACGLEVKNCRSIENASKVKCEEGRCVVETCIEGYHPGSEDNSICKPEQSPTHCGIGELEKDCTAISNIVDASSVMCEDNKCVVKECRENFHINKYKDACTSDSVDECGPDLTDCSEIYQAQELSCKKGVCNYTCAEGTDKYLDFLSAEGCYICKTGDITKKICSATECDGITVSGTEECIIDGNLNASFDEGGESLAYDKLIQLQKDVKITSNGNMNSISFKKLEKAGNFIINGPATKDIKLNSLYLPKLKSAGITFHNVSIDELSFPELVDTGASDLLIQGFAAQTYAGTTLRGTSISKLSFPKLVTANVITISGFEQLTTIDFSSLERVKRLDVQYNKSIRSTVSFPVLTEAPGITVRRGSFSFPLLKTSEVTYYPGESTSIDLPVFESGRLYVVDANRMPDFKTIAPNLKYKDFKLYFEDFDFNKDDYDINQGKFVLDFDELANLVISYGENCKNCMKEITMSKLKKINYLAVRDQLKLQKISAPNLQEIGNELQIKNHPELTEIDLSGLGAMDADKITIKNCPKLTAAKCKLGKNTCVIQND